MLLVGPLDLDRVRGAIDVLDLLLALDRRADVDLFDRLGGVFRRAQREEEIGQPFLLAAELRIAQRDRAARAGRHGKDARAEQARADPFQQRRVAILAHDLLVHPPGLLGVEQLGRIFLAVDQQRHLLDRAVVGQREDERHFHRPAAGVDERLRHLHLRHLIDQPGLDVQFLDLVAHRRQRRRDAESGAAAR